MSSLPDSLKHLTDSSTVKTEVASNNERKRKKTAYTLTSLYRNGTLGITLKDTLEDMMEEGILPNDESLKEDLMIQFDHLICTTLVNENPTRGNFRGKVEMYRGVEEVFRWIVNDFEMEVENSNIVVKAPRVNIVAVQSAEMLDQAIERERSQNKAKRRKTK